MTGARAVFFLLLFLAVTVLEAAASYAQTGPQRAGLTIGLADNRIAITTGFDGSRLTLFGVRNEPGDLAIVVRGPRREMVVRHKDRIMGMWMNAEAVRFRQVPSYYDYAVSAPEGNLTSAARRRQLELGLDALDFRHAGREDASVVERFATALIRNKQTEGHFPLMPGVIYFLSDNFFRASFDLPSSVPTGEYVIRAYLFRDGEVVGMRETTLRVGQEGFSARIYLFAHDQAFWYGLFAVLFAIFAGWSAWALLRRE